MNAGKSGEREAPLYGRRDARRYGGSVPGRPGEATEGQAIWWSRSASTKGQATGGRSWPEMTSSRPTNQGESIGGFQSRRDCDPKPGVARHELPRVGWGISTNPDGVAPARRNPVGVVNPRKLENTTEGQATGGHSWLGEPSGNPGGETPPSTAGETPAATEAREHNRGTDDLRRGAYRPEPAAARRNRAANSGSFSAIPRRNPSATGLASVESCRTRNTSSSGVRQEENMRYSSTRSFARREAASVVL